MDPVTKQIIAGVIQGSIFAAVLWLIGPKRALWLNAGLLIIAGILYVAFAAAAGRPDAIPLEIAGTLFVTGFAVAGILRRSPAILSVGWALHPVWDVAFHTRGLGTYAPDGYAVVCIGFDLALALLILVIKAHPRTIFRAARAQ